MDYMMKSESEIRQRFQTTIPQDIREKAKLQVGDQLIWQYDEVRNEIIVMPKPKNFSDAIWGLGKELWEKGKSDEYIRKERAGWE